MSSTSPKGVAKNDLVRKFPCAEGFQARNLSHQVPRKKDGLTNLSTAFGYNPDHTWEVLRRVVKRSLKNRFYTVSEEDIEDATSDAVLRLVEYWAGLPTSLTENLERNWNYACWYARKYAAHCLSRNLRATRHEVFFSTPLSRNGDGGGRSHNPAPDDTYENYVSSLAQEAEVTDQEYDARVDKFFEELSPDDLAEFQPKAEGKTTRQLAREQGVSHQAVSARQSRRRNKLAIVAKRCGLKVA